MRDYDGEALKYLRAKFPGVNDSVFHTDYTGCEYDYIPEVLAVLEAARIDSACSKCKGECLLEGKKSRPVVQICEHVKGYKYMRVNWTCGLNCRYDELSGDFGRMFRNSGLTEKQLKQTFKSYRNYDAETGRAKCAAFKASQDNSGLVLSGKRGTGKTHLAVAVGLESMHHGRQSKFYLVNELLDELRDANVNDHEGYNALMKSCKEVPCLILDDLGKERTTGAGLDYLYQIVDYRYRHDLQTVITTNALSVEELASWGNGQYTTPMVSRVLERGSWVKLEHVKDYRVSGHAE